MDQGEEIRHVQDQHQDEIFDKLKENYGDDIWELIKGYLDVSYVESETTNSFLEVHRLIHGIREYHEASSELVFEDHDINDGHHDNEYDECAANDTRNTERG